MTAPYSWPTQTAPTRYPWQLWMNGQVHVAIPGTHFSPDEGGYSRLLNSMLMHARRYRGRFSYEILPSGAVALTYTSACT